MIIRDCPNVMCTDPLYAGKCKKECVERYEREMGIKKADLVEVVRCKDCKHLTVYNSPTLYAYCQKTHLRFEPFQEDTRTHFCSLGERKDNGNQT